MTCLSSVAALKRDGLKTNQPFYEESLKEPHFIELLEKVADQIMIPVVLPST